MFLYKNLFEMQFINQNNGSIVYIMSPQQVSGLKFDKKLNGIGILALTMPFNQTVWDIFKLDLLVEIYTINHSTNKLVKEQTFFMLGKEIYYEDDRKHISFSGASLEYLISKRIVKPTTLDDTNAGGYVTRAGSAGEVLEQFFDEQLVNPDDSNRAFQNLTINRIDEGVDVGVRVRYTNLIEPLNTITTRSEVGYWFERTTQNNIRINIGFVGENKTYDNVFPSTGYLVFDPNYGNIINPLFKLDYKDGKNYVYVLGEGEGVNQQILELTNSETSLSIYNRNEVAFKNSKAEKDSSSAYQQLLTAGITKLEDEKVKKEFTFKILEAFKGYHYNIDFSLGDIVTFYWEGENVDFTIVEMVFTTQSNQIDREFKLEVRI